MKNGFLNFLLILAAFFVLAFSIIPLSVWIATGYLLIRAVMLTVANWEDYQILKKENVRAGNQHSKNKRMGLFIAMLPGFLMVVCTIAILLLRKDNNLFY